MVLLFKLFSYNITLVNIIDVILVMLLIYQLFKMVSGTLGLNVLLGMIIIYIMYHSVKFLGFYFLSEILGYFVNAGVIALLIVFQPEIRRFLLMLGKGGISEKINIPHILKYKRRKSRQHDQLIGEIIKATENLSLTMTGALIVFSDHFKLQDLTNPGVPIQGLVSQKLLESIFNKTSPLHDGAVIIVKNKIIFAGTVLPISDNPELPAGTGLRHRSAVGITEHSDATALIVSEETGKISFAKNGKLTSGISETELYTLVHDIVLSAT